MKYIIKSFLFSILFIFFIAHGLHAEDLTVHFNELTYKNERFLSDLSLNGDISDDTIYAIQNGITANLFLTFQLMKSNRVLARGSNLKGEKVHSFEISYDPMGNNYIIINGKDTYYVDKPSDIIEKINEIINPLRIKVSSDHIKDKIIFRAKVEIETIKLYPPFGIFLVFFDPWNYESGWINTDDFTLEKL
jgi:hypothetical protein